MSPHLSDMPQHLVLAFDHHQRLLREAQQQREAQALQRSRRYYPLRWRIGDLLINIGQRLKMGTTGAVWG